MTPPDVLDVARDAITVLLLVSGPVMLVGLSVCLLIALFQALTQLQEMTLTFVPKILAVFTSLLLLRPFMMTSLISFMERIAQRIVAGAPGLPRHAGANPTGGPFFNASCFRAARCHTDDHTRLWRDLYLAAGALHSGIHVDAGGRAGRGSHVAGSASDTGRVSPHDWGRGRGGRADRRVRAFDD